MTFFSIPIPWEWASPQWIKICLTGIFIFYNSLLWWALSLKMFYKFCWIKTTELSLSTSQKWWHFFLFQFSDSEIFSLVPLEIFLSSWLIYRKKNLQDPSNRAPVTTTIWSFLIYVFFLIPCGWLSLSSQNVNILIFDGLKIFTFSYILIWDYFSWRQERVEERGT